MSMIVLLVILVVLALWAVGIYNGLVAGRNGYKNAFAQIDVQLTRRYDLIPNLVETAKGYMKHERETLEAVIQARNSAVSGLTAAKANPGDAAATIARNYDETAGLVLARLSALPLLTERAARRGDVIETLVDDHSTRTMKGSVGIITDIETSLGDAVHKIVVRYAKRTVDYVPEDFKDLRFVR
jgi:hypothetical protein